MLMRRHERLVEIQADANDQRIIRHTAIAEEAGDVIDHAFLDERTLAVGGDAGRPWMLDPLTNAFQPLRIVPGKAGSDDAVEPHQRHAAARTQIDRCVEGGQIGRCQREHDDTEKGAVLGVDPSRHIDRDLVRDPAGHRLANVNAANGS
jgi:hypothetical protein